MVQSRHLCLWVAAILHLHTSCAFASTETKSPLQRHQSAFSLPTSTSLDAQSMSRLKNSHSRLLPPQEQSTKRGLAPAMHPSTRIHQSSIPMEFPPTTQRRLPTANPLQPLDQQRTTSSTITKKATQTKTALGKIDYAIFLMYFCNMLTINLSVVTIPAMASQHLHGASLATFCAGVASMAPLGGGIGKVINGFVCQRLGGRSASWIYLAGLAVLSQALSYCHKSLAPIGMILMGFEFLSSIQWTSACHLLSQEYGQARPHLFARGVALLSLASTSGALVAKMFGASLLKVSDWQTVTRCGTFMAIVGSACMYFLGKTTDSQKEDSVSTRVVQGESKASTAKKGGPFDGVKAILGSKVFWTIGIAHSLGFIARGNDRLIGPFLFDISALPRHICASLTSAVTVGFLMGLSKGSQFSKLNSVAERMTMLKRNYRMAFLSVLGMVLCPLAASRNLLNAPILAGLATVFSGITAACVSFQFFQLPNMVSANMFPEQSAVSLSWVDAAGFFATAPILALNSRVLAKFGWSASWSFLALIFAIGGRMMMTSIQPVLEIDEKNRKRG